MLDILALRAFLDGCLSPEFGDSEGAVVSGVSTETPYAYEIDDLFHLYSTVRKSSCVSALEFGSGWSTIVLALGLYENAQSFGDEHRQSVRHPNPFQLLTIDASEHWQGIALSRAPDWLRPTIRAVSCGVRLGDRYGGLVHFYDRVPDFSADLIYLDGPDPEQVSGVVDGFEYAEFHTLPMGGDILRMEPHLWPETIIITDGRTANARFLASNLRRNWQVLHDPFGDRSTFRLEETPLGPIGERHVAVRLKAARALADKEERNQKLNTSDF